MKDTSKIAAPHMHRAADCDECQLRREFPRIPFYKDFWHWSELGKQLMDLHIGYESVKPVKLKRIDVPDEKAKKAGMAPKCILRADKAAERIVVDSETTLEGSRQRHGSIS